ncbi:CsbD family protein [Amorphus coralli]|uniref:CsbD family protein n=1 Tax=Amorphus coralli TaxID=340680 RepID=UPI001FE1CE20|nr:CsbD family protein [Amorphus coralli]
MLEQIRDNWRPMKGAVQERWFRLTDDDLDQIDGRLERLVRRIQARYGVTSEEAHDQVNQWYARLIPERRRPIQTRKAPAAVL